MWPRRPRCRHPGSPRASWAPPSHGAGRRPPHPFRCVDLSLWGQVHTPKPFVGLAADALLELGLFHLRAALDVLVLGLVVELVAGATAGALVGAEATPPPGRD